MPTPLPRRSDGGKTVVVIIPFRDREGALGEVQGVINAAPFPSLNWGHMTSGLGNRESCCRHTDSLPVILLSNRGASSSVHLGTFRVCLGR